MRFSLDWLSDFVDVAVVGGPAEIDRLLNLVGIEIGTIAEFAGDVVLDADITPNRPDAMNHRGLARDLAAARGIAFRGELERYREPAGEGDRASDLARVSIEVPEKCHRFAVKVIRDTSTAPSGERLRRRFEAIGLAPINVLIDATNLSLWEIGQPLHAFDADKVAGRHLVVRQARPGEKLLFLDGVERELHPEDVVVADERRVLSLAGVMGGADSAISDTTTNVLLESAWWDPVSIRRTSRRHGLHTDASHRYERGTDIAAVPEGLSLAVREILDSAGGRVARGTIDASPRPFSERTISLRGERLRALAGEPSLTEVEAGEILERLGFKVAADGPGLLRVAVPSWRRDVEIEEDVIEEVVRIYGYDRLPSRLPSIEKSAPRFLDAPLPDGPPSAREAEDRAADGLREAGLFEAINVPFSRGETWEGEFGNLLEVDGFAPIALRVTNPLDQARAHLRRLILPGLLEAASTNFRNGALSIALFETGRVWDRDGSSGGAAGDPPAYESRHAAFLLAGQAPGFWDHPPRPYDYFDGRAAAERLLDAFPETGGSEAFSLVPAGVAAFVPGAVAALLDGGGKRLGVIGRLTEGQTRAHRLPPASIAGELDLGALIAPRTVRRFEAYSVFPPIDVDITLTHEARVSWASIREHLAAAQLAGLESYSYTDRFAGSGLPPGVVKSTISLRFRSGERTLSQEEVNRERDRFLDLLQRKYGVEHDR